MKDKPFDIKRRTFEFALEVIDLSKLAANFQRKQIK
jgi:hypothetical protein